MKQPKQLVHDMVGKNKDADMLNVSKNNKRLLKYNQAIRRDVLGHNALSMFPGVTGLEHKVMPENRFQRSLASEQTGLAVHPKPNGAKEKIVRN